ncbi:uncharacterized protein MYCFIDRAFT_205654 [Pseudocercospora fijiensis CIRAD86]|uniref:Uncharacterized protein n=1 Tax=Pseudocercospora fijiensis (strain CIRAD86) TaxID=383855 RepID=N1Q5U8_PSEFD|nr:uncharacterized protein MYCFIDRAFT_205654 [Pseudocercospora fijiensis CIRAD86]EME87374.1 hypothetical protein MYCFIDRAFT_205654 [Pseudocercospora fijiensis CIRAD86]
MLAKFFQFAFDAASSHSKRQANSTRHCIERDRPSPRLPIMIDRLAESHYIRNRAPLLQRIRSRSGPRARCELDLLTPDSDIEVIEVPDDMHKVLLMSTSSWSFSGKSSLRDKSWIHASYHVMLWFEVQMASLKDALPLMIRFPRATLRISRCGCDPHSLIDSKAASRVQTFVSYHDHLIFS